MQKMVNYYAIRSSSGGSSAGLPTEARFEQM
jgi:hypothetical protein